MAVKISVKGTYEKVARELNKRGEQAARALDRSLRDMRRAAPTVVARQTTGVYGIKQGEVNANSEKFQGGCRMSGGVSDLTLQYTGRMLTPTHFGMSPRSAGGGRAYTIRATILRGHRSKLGHWRRPWSQGGAYGRESPYMLMPGKVPPIQRRGGKTARRGNGFSHAGGEHAALKTISVPQMVGSERHIEGTMEMLQERCGAILQRHLRSIGIEP